MDDTPDSPDRCIRCPFCGRSFHEHRIPTSKGTDRTCLRCGHVWRSRGEGRPARCPSCRSSKWNLPDRMNVCLRCGHEWYPRGGARSVKCPSCMARNWDVLGDGFEDAAETPVRDPLDSAEAMYAEGSSCIEAACFYGVPLETLMTRIRGKTCRNPRMTSDSRV